jgi:hypothetical protein
MQEVVVPINTLAVVLAAVSTMVVGSLWYGPLFGKEWMKLTGHKPDPAKKKEMGKLYALQFLGSLVMAYVMAHTMVFAASYMKVTGVSAGLSNAFWSWLGFVAPITLGTVLWDGKPWKLFAINAGHYLATMLVMGAILGAM